MSYMTQSGFKPKKTQLDVIKEFHHHEEIEEQDDELGTSIGLRVKSGSKKFVGERTSPDPMIQNY